MPRISPQQQKKEIKEPEPVREVVEREINLSLLNFKLNEIENKVNYIISLLKDNDN